MASGKPERLDARHVLERSYRVHKTKKNRKPEGMGLLASVATFLLAAVMPPNPCPFEAQYRWLSTSTNIPVAVLPPNPTLPNSTAIFDSANRSDAYDPTLYPTFEAILLPLNTMNLFLQNVTRSPITTCKQLAPTVINTWARRGALTGRMNPYSMLLHRITVGNIAITYLNQTRTPLIRYDNSVWFRQLHASILRQPVPYTNNFRMFEFRALVTTAIAAKIPHAVFLAMIDQFLGSVIRNGTIITELCGPKTIQYHIYFLGPLFDTLYILWRTTGRRTSQMAALDAVIKTIEETPPRTFIRLLGYTPFSALANTITSTRQKWNCLRTGLRCTLFAGLDRLSSNR